VSPTLTALAVVSMLSAARAPAAVKPSNRSEANPHAGQSRVSERSRARLAAAARRHLGKPFRGDCSGFVRRVYAEAGVPLPSPVRARSGTESIVRSLAPTRRPRPGDVAYFHRTHDREPPGPGRNLFTHIAVVESVDGRRVSLVHRSNTGVERLRMDLARPADPEVNGALRRRKASDRRGQPYLASQLLAGFASPFGGASAGPDVVAKAKQRSSARRPAAAGAKDVRRLVPDDAGRRVERRSDRRARDDRGVYRPRSGGQEPRDRS
jgi:hypothetical protein